MTQALPQIAEHGYRLDAVATFLQLAPPEHVARYQRDCIGHGPFILWDPEDDADGFMVAAMSVADLNREFCLFFADVIEGLPHADP